MASRSYKTFGKTPTGERATVSWLLFATFLIFPVSICYGQAVVEDLPANGSIRIENQRGSVKVLVSEEDRVNVETSYDGDAPNRSPVIIRKTSKLLNVLVAKDATGKSTTRVNLVIRVPAKARLEIVTNTGDVDLLGVPASLSVLTLSGRVDMALPPNGDVDITVASTTGQVKSELPKSASLQSRGKSFRFRLGSGRVPIKLTTKSGEITVRLHNTDGERDTAQTNTTPPTLIGKSGSTQPAGTPASSSSEPQEIDEGDIIRVDSELVTLNVSVVDRATSRGIIGLTQNEFKVFEDGAEQKLQHFEASSAPFNLVLLVDVSDSTKGKLDLIRSATQHFVDAARPADSIAIITFANTPIVLSRLTNDRKLLRQSVDSMTSAPGTKLYDSIHYVISDVLKDAGRSRRTALVVMSDGLDGALPSVTGDGSTLSYPEVLSEVREFDGVLYGLWVNTEYESLSDKDTQPEDFDTGHDRMSEMAEAGGGLFYEVDKLVDLAGVYERVVADIGTVYSLSYRPTNEVRDGKWRAIRVKLDRPNAIARGKRGYYAK